MSTSLVRPASTRLSLESLEEREVPAINIAISYGLDLRANGGSGFFEDHPEAKAALSRVAQDLGQMLTANLSAITPSGGNSWSAGFYNPVTGRAQNISNLNVAANTIIVYVGGRAMPGGTAAVGGPGGYGWSGTAAWGNTVQSRGWSGFATWGGSLAFDTTENWHFGLTTSGLDYNETDFYTVAAHELGHLIGIGTSTQWTTKIRNGTFIGTNAVAAYGGAVPVSSDSAHWGTGLKSNGQYAVMDPTLSQGQRRTWTSLDLAVFRDLGWAVSSPVSPPVSPPPPASPPVSPPPPVAPPVSPPPVSPPAVVAVAPVLVPGQSGQVMLYARNSSGALSFTGQTFTPFAGYTGTIRTAVADFNGDKVADYAFTTGSGIGARTHIINGATGKTLVNTSLVLGGFTGGAFIAAGDINRDGKAELVVSSDRGRIPLVEVYTISGGQLVKSMSFAPFTSSLATGARIALGDINRDGYQDLIVGAGPGRDPAIRIFNGASLAVGKPVAMGPAFLAFASSVTTGVNVASGDINGDGYADLIVSQESGGNSLVRVWSGAAIAARPTVAVSSLATMQQFYANGTTDRNGIRIIASDLNGDGKAEVITTASIAKPNWVRVLSVSSASVAAVQTVFPTSPPVVAALHTTSATSTSDFDNFLPPSAPCLCCQTGASMPYCRRVTG